MAALLGRRRSEAAGQRVDPAGGVLLAVAALGGLLPASLTVQGVVQV